MYERTTFASKKYLGTRTVSHLVKLAPVWCDTVHGVKKVALFLLQWSLQVTSSHHAKKVQTLQAQVLWEETSLEEKGTIVMAWWNSIHVLVYTCYALYRLLYYMCVHKQYLVVYHVHVYLFSHFSRLLSLPYKIFILLFPPCLLDGPIRLRQHHSTQFSCARFRVHHAQPLNR